MNNFTVVREVLRNNYRSHNLIGPYHFWRISPRNSTLFTRPFFTGRHARARHETKYVHGLKEQNGSQPEMLTVAILSLSCSYCPLISSWTVHSDSLYAQFHLNPVVTITCKWLPLTTVACNLAQGTQIHITIEHITTASFPGFNPAAAWLRWSLGMRLSVPYIPVCCHWLPPIPLSGADW